ncbi:MAG: hypothetical protein P8173_14915 [Gammaproteobacteria bacterium]|jgi:hypothetical protein
MAEEDWKKIIDDADAKAAAEADKVVQDDLDQISAQATQLRGIFEKLRLTDRKTYDQLTQIIEDATRQNESIGHVIERLKALGAAGSMLADSIANVASGGTIGLLSAALKAQSRSG